jgi:hypothetical protein
MLRRSAFNSSARWVLGSVALGPKLLFTGIRVMNAPSGLSFPIEPTNMATSSALWAWAGLAIGIGLFFIIESRAYYFPGAGNAAVVIFPIVAAAIDLI